MQVQDKIYIGIGGLFILYALANYTYGQPPTTTNNESAEVSLKPVKIIAVGDINLGRQTGQKILAGEINYPFANISDYLKSADITFGNLESQLADLGGETQSPTNEYRFAGPPTGADSLAAAGFDIISLANNHMWDYGKDHLLETIDNLERLGIKYTGASKTTENLYQPVVMEINGQKIAWFAVTAILNGYENAGAKDYVAWADDDRLIAAIQQLRNPPPESSIGVNWIIVSMHRGVEYAATPSTPQIKFAHKVIDAGANVVIGHHPHVPEGIESYNNGIIFYSLGNFAFWQPFDYWTQHSFVVELTLHPDGKFDHLIVPINAGWQPELSNETDQTKIKEYLLKLSDKLNGTSENQ